jgi:hypothetical protein
MPTGSAISAVFPLVVLILAPTAGSATSLRVTTTPRSDQHVHIGRPSFWHFLQMMLRFMAYFVSRRGRHYQISEAWGNDRTMVEAREPKRLTPENRREAGSRRVEPQLTAEAPSPSSRGPGHRPSRR